MCLFDILSIFIDGKYMYSSTIGKYSKYVLEHRLQNVSRCWAGIWVERVVTLDE